MRPIKFKAWHSGLNKMFSAAEMSDDQLTLLPTGKFINVSGTHTRFSTIIAQMIPLQFTGFYDKTGKEIYEGDKDAAGNVVEFCNGSWCLNGDRPLSVMYKSFRIHGNKYEDSKKEFQS